MFDTPLPQEVAVDGQDVVYKDIIEPLESVSVSITPTQREDLSEIGTADEVNTPNPKSKSEGAFNLKFKP